MTTVDSTKIVSKDSYLLLKRVAMAKVFTTSDLTKDEIDVMNLVHAKNMVCMFNTKWKITKKGKAAIKDYEQAEGA